MEVKIKKFLLIIAPAVLVGLIIRFIFNIDGLDSLWSLMTISFFFFLPYAVGAISVYLSKPEDVRSLSYRIFFPWVPVLFLFIVTMLLNMEGWACWLMILPVFLIFSSLGGLTAGYFKTHKSKRSNNLHVSLAVLLPFLICPLENMIGAIPGFYTAYTAIDIEAPKDKIWSHVIRVKAITETEDRGTLTNFLNIPRPIKAELDFEGVGAKREAIFDGGLIFNESVLQYEHQKLMKFSIRANTYEIPSTTFDEHILIGGEFFDVLEGTYELEKLSPEKYRLHLYSEFKLNTTFNFYASIWGRWIMQDIQNNILQVIKNRSEKK
ncbi:MAG TPA: hypothetical protein PK325_17705 [Cyclobacteriaceae bacterium]|nr:hypothetical protein [Cyclobacteriaceae bacterium]HMV08433.1 hypothetical protein [Cyclobacteriaceae bacterium]HMV91168.1 hypothetical protein [Cyclobacteriaceae bacterium]HMX01206.1 hypothetical protein [Cyclobacteriaceae bacterium]HMX50609.1 hypothetical protein [Cyclobacteriaceae bacterium]